MRKPLERAVFLGTTNPAKQSRLRGLLDGLPVEVQTPEQTGLRLEVPETSRTHQENATEKATAWSRLAEGPALASDGGLVVPALGNRWNSLRTHRFAGEHADDVTKAGRLLQMMEGLTGRERTVYWIEAVALAHKGVAVACWQVTSREARLANSFDPAALEPGFWITGLLVIPPEHTTNADEGRERPYHLEEPWGQLRPLVQKGVLAFFQRPTQ